MSVKILVSDGLSPDGLELLAKSGEVVSNSKIAPAELLAALPEFDALVVRSRTKVTAPVLAAGTRLKVVGRAGVAWITSMWPPPWRAASWWLTAPWRPRSRWPSTPWA